MDKERLQSIVAAEAMQYLDDTDRTQSTIQEARNELKRYRLGRKAVTDWEQHQVETVYAADKLLRQELSATLKAKTPRNQRGQS